MEIRLGDVVTMRKQHPCGGWDWKVVRLGADIGIRCLKCDRRVLIARSTFERRVKRFVARGDATIATGPGNLPEAEPRQPQ